MNGKQFVLAIAFIAVLLTMAFIPVSSQQVGGYDPWLDINGDGIIDMMDLATAARSYGTSGDPTRSVYVTNWPAEEPDYQVLHLGIFNITSGLTYSFAVPDWNHPIPADEYTKFSVLYDVFDMSPGNYRLNVSVAAITWWIVHGPYAQEHVKLSQISLTRHAEGFDATIPTVDLTEIKAPHFNLEFQTQTDSPNWQNIWILINVYVYLRK